MFCKDSLSVVIPVYNEEKSIKSAIDGVVDVLKRLEIDFELIIVDDGSNDGTEKVLSACVSHEPRLKIVKHEHNFGKGKALRTGIAETSKDWVLFMDADLQIPADEVEFFLSLPPEISVFAGYRNKQSYEFRRKVISWCNAWFTSMLFGLTIRDCNCPFKFFKAELLKSLNVSTNGFGIDAELLWRSVQAGGKIQEFPVVSVERVAGVSKVTLSSCVKCVYELLKIRVTS